MDPRKGTAFLDLGCGTGWAVCRVATLLEGQGLFAGVDISGKMIEKAVSNSKGLANIHFHVASVEALPLDNDSFDNVICTFSFHHYLNPGKALSEVRRALKPKGKFFILDATPDDFAMKWFDRIGAKYDKGHVKQYSIREFGQMFAENGLKHLGSRTILMYPVKAHIAEK